MTRRQLFMIIAAAVAAPVTATAGDLHITKPVQPTEVLTVTEVVLLNHKLVVERRLLPEPVNLVPGDSLDIHYTYDPKQSQA